MSITKAYKNLKPAKPAFQGDSIFNQPTSGGKVGSEAADAAYIGGQPSDARVGAEVATVGAQAPQSQQGWLGKTVGDVESSVTGFMAEPKEQTAGIIGSAAAGWASAGAKFLGDIINKPIETGVSLYGQALGLSFYHIVLAGFGSY